MADKLDPRWHGALIEDNLFHFHRRLLERWDVVLGPGDYTAMRQMIRRGRATYIRTTERGGKVYAVRVPSVDKVVMVVVSGWRFCTAYPPQKRYMRRHPTIFPDVD